MSWNYIHICGYRILEYVRARAALNFFLLLLHWVPRKTWSRCSDHGIIECKTLEIIWVHFISGKASSTILFLTDSYQGFACLCDSKFFRYRLIPGSWILFQRFNGCSIKCLSVLHFWQLVALLLTVDLKRQQHSHHYNIIIVNYKAGCSICY